MDAQLPVGFPPGWCHLLRRVPWAELLVKSLRHPEDVSCGVTVGLFQVASDGHFAGFGPLDHIPYFLWVDRFYEVIVELALGSTSRARCSGLCPPEIGKVLFVLISRVETPIETH